MAQVDSDVLGSRIREARERAGLKQGELADRVDIDRTGVNKIENGTRRVTAIELSDIARALGVRMGSFFEDPLPALVSHRSSQGLDTADSKIDQLLADLASEVEFVDSLVPPAVGLTEAASRLDGMTIAHPATHDEADQLAAQARELLGLDNVSPVVDLVDRVASIGLWAFVIDLGVDTADAGTLLLKSGGVSLVNGHNKPGRQRLALAHELGHYLVQDEYSIDWRVVKSGVDVEAQFDRFARALLLPEDGLTEVWKRHSGTGELREAAIRAASEFRVDMSTLARRLGELNLFQGDLAQIREVSTGRSDIVELGLVVPFDGPGPVLSAAFQKAVIHLYREEKVSLERALDLLRGTFAAEDLPARRERRADEIWQFVS